MSDAAPHKSGATQACQPGGVLTMIRSPHEPLSRATPVRWGELSDGLSATLLVYECSGRVSSPAGLWGCAMNAIAIDFPVNVAAEAPTIVSRHAGGGFALFCDGRVEFITTETDVLVLGALQRQCAVVIVPAWRLSKSTPASVGPGRGPGIGAGR